MEGQFWILFLLLLTGIIQVHNMKVEWEDFESQTYKSSSLVYGGQEGTDESPTYICRIAVKSSSGRRMLIPGKLVTRHNTCYVAYYNNEYYGRKSEGVIQVLNQVGNPNFYWIKSSGPPPKNAIEGGYSSSGRKLFICRTVQPVLVSKFLWTGEAVLVGNIRDGESSCYASWMNSAKAYYNYEVLVAKESR